MFSAGVATAKLREKRMSHISATICTGPANFCALTHHAVSIRMGFAEGRARQANFCTFSGQMHMVRRTTRHEICMHQANLCAVQQADQVQDFAVIAVPMHDVSSSGRTDAVTCQTVDQALFHFFIKGREFHFDSPFMTE